MNYICHCQFGIALPATYGFSAHHWDCISSHLTLFIETLAHSSSQVIQVTTPKSKVFFSFCWSYEIHYLGLAQVIWHTSTVWLWCAFSLHFNTFSSTALWSRSPSTEISEQVQDLSMNLQLIFLQCAYQENAYKPLHYSTTLMKILW